MWKGNELLAHANFFFYILHYIFSILLVVVVVDFFILALKDLFPKKCHKF